MAIVDINSDFDNLLDEKVFIISYTGEDELNEILFHIKKHQKLDIYAKPILLLNQFNIKIPPYFIQAVDKVIDNKYYENFMYEQDVMISEINGKIDFLKKSNYENNNVTFRILRYLYVRNISLMPYQTIKNNYGYTYPKIDHFLNEGEWKIFEAFDFLTKRNLLEAVFVDRCHFCLECHSAFLNFKEVCPRCFSVDIKSEALIHHFECAYVGLEHEFKHGKKLLCPKCDKELFHIGVDYDKPSFIYTCNKCQHEFQEALIQSTCFNCNSTFDVDNLILRDIYEYKLTVLSENAALFGFENLFNSMLDENLDILPTHIFNRFLEIEVMRVQRYKKSLSTLVKLNLTNLDEIYDDVNNFEKIKKIFTQLADLIKGFLRTSDVITVFNDVIYEILLIETNMNGAKIATDRLKSQIEELFEVNLGHNYEIEISLKEINEQSSLEDLMEFLK